MASGGILNIFQGVSFDESIIKYQSHPYSPYSSTTYDYNDTIRIPINKTDIYTLPSESYLYLEGKFKTEEEGKASQLTNNAFAFLFEEIRYELNGTEIDRVRNPGIASSLKGYASFNQADKLCSSMAGWHQTVATATVHQDDVNVCIPLKYLLGFFEDYKKLVINAKQEIVLVRSRNDNNMYKGDASKFVLNKLLWYVPHVIVNDEIKLAIYQHMEEDIFIPFRQWELHELPSLKENSLEKWAVRTTSELEKPRFVIIGFQKNKKDNIKEDGGKFDAAGVRNIQLYLNSEVYPYTKYNLDFEHGRYMLAYYAYCEFQKQYYGRGKSEPLISLESFKNNPIFVIDASKQTESIQTSSVDVALELEAQTKFSSDTCVYCLVLHDCIYRYNPTTGDVKRES